MSWIRNIWSESSFSVFLFKKCTWKKNVHDIVQSFIALWYNKYFISNNSRCAKDNKHIHSFILFQTLVKHVNIQKLCVSLFELKTSSHVRSHDHFISSSYCYPKCFTCATCNNLVLTIMLLLLFEPEHLVIKEITNKWYWFFVLQKQNTPQKILH